MLKVEKCLKKNDNHSSTIARATRQVADACASVTFVLAEGRVREKSRWLLRS
jgi:hypothetical protein